MWRCLVNQGLVIKVLKLGKRMWRSQCYCFWWFHFTYFDQKMKQKLYFNNCSMMSTTYFELYSVLRMWSCQNIHWNSFNFLPYILKLIKSQYPHFFFQSNQRFFEHRKRRNCLFRHCGWRSCQRDSTVTIPGNFKRSPRCLVII